eukprot:2430081-Rhodomonas_salina.2
MIQEITRLKSTPSFNSGNVRAFNAQLGIPDTSPPQAPQNVAFVPTQEEIEQLERERAEMWEIKKRYDCDQALALVAAVAIYQEQLLTWTMPGMSTWKASSPMPRRRWRTCTTR